MAESTLTLAYWDALDEVSDFLAWGRGHTNESNLARVREVVEAGYRQFLWPPAVDRSGPHAWSFLTPKTTFETVEDDIDYDLPDDFGGMATDEMTVDEDGVYSPVLLRGEGFLRDLHAGGDVSARPQYFAVRPKALTRTTGQRWELLIWPIPTAALTVEYRYHVVAGKWGYVIVSGTGVAYTNSTKTFLAASTTGVTAGDKVIVSSVTASGASAGIYVVASVVADTSVTLTTALGADDTIDYEILPANLYPYGGAQHSDTLLESCLSIAERRRDDTKGVHWDVFMNERLPASIALDRGYEPRNFGPMSGRTPIHNIVQAPNVTYQGELPG